jgi:hypothetical protein
MTQWPAANLETRLIGRPGLLAVVNPPDVRAAEHGYRRVARQLDGTTATVLSKG